MNNKEVTEFKEIKLPLGIGLDEAYDILRNNAPSKCNFVDAILYSTDSLDDMYLKVTG